MKIDKTFKKCFWAVALSAILALAGCERDTATSAPKHLQALMVTPLLVYSDFKQVCDQADAVSESKNYNAIAACVDLPLSDRGYILSGRTPTALTRQCARNLREVLSRGVGVVLIIRNDYAVCNRLRVALPSIEGETPPTASEFYGPKALQNEISFIESLEPFYGGIDIQLSIETHSPESAEFALKLSERLRQNGFQNKILINPLGAAIPAHQRIAKRLSELGVVWARSCHATTSPDPVHNTDGNLAITADTAKHWLGIIGDKQFILWGRETKNCPNGIPGGYL